jgi:signal transduction histidine kinase
MVSHELRQPLATLTYAVPLLKSEPIRADAIRHEHVLGVLERNVVRLVELMDQLENLSRLQSVNPGHARCSAYGRWSRRTRGRAPAAGNGRRARRGHPGCRRSPELVVDRARLELILTNLISNGIKYSDPQKTEKWVHVETCAAVDPATVCLVVRDNGIGIPAVSLRAIFGRFVRAHASRDEELRVRGSGLGLAIASNAAAAIGAELRVESTPGEGTAFFIDLRRE